MTDYGHDLVFGTFITPRSRHPREVLDLARLTELAGLDLVTFPDLPYDPDILEAWTLLSYVAAETERVRLSPYVVSLPAHLPAVLAHEAASLDVLSSGRVELGLGRGYDSDAIASIGGPRRGSAEAVDALDEAIDIIRAIWDVSAPGGVRVAGEHYRVRGAHRGPRPAHDVSIWVLAEGPRAWGLVGRKADGWIAGGLMLTDVEGELAAGNRIIDDCARRAGRDPREVRRLLDFEGNFARFGRGFVHGTPEQWVEQLLPLVIDHGVSTFILAVDDPRAIERWGREVAPALRQAVALERATFDAPPVALQRAL
jgi:alkanesulfonate monooxygenase SsuD/methylene tetrahydromethanopterin reductase-like flavin-dependent oxidoreductase (luciferase family)